MLIPIDFRLLFDKLYNMKKVTAREFQHGFSKTAESLKPGQSVTVTKRGKPLGVFTRLPARRVRMPDFLANLQATGVSKELGNQILKEFSDSLS